jgi:predicted transcriptional regulator
MVKSKIREITIKESKNGFNIFKTSGIAKEDYDFDGLSALRSLLSNEKARIMNVIKTKKPKSIYELAKILGRPFKAVFDDIKFLERFGFINFIKESSKKRVSYRPELAVDKIIVHFEI